ncbi:MAG: hypothetical protein LBM95_05115 [Lactobacillales bacterium]|jgi:hypothetical protein|nr:hypothetical protein [Lactobacillales bacterium]
MAFYEIVLLGAAVLATIFFFFFVYNLVSIIRTKKEEKQLLKKRFKTKKKQKQQHILLTRFHRKQKRNILGMILMFFLLVGTLGGAGYYKFFESTKLKGGDMSAISNGYYYVYDMKNLLTTIQKGESSPKELKNTRFLADRMTTYGVLSANDKLTSEGQLVINRYYTSLKELGNNISAQLNNYPIDTEVQQSIQSNISRVEKNQKEVIQMYKINESALAKKK